MNITHKPITLWQLIAYQLLFHIAIAAVCMFAANFVLNHYWLPFYFQMEDNFPRPRGLLLEAELDHYQSISETQLQELYASLQVLDESLTVIDSRNSSVATGYQYSEKELLSLLLVDRRDHLISTKQLKNAAGETIIVLLEQQLDSSVFELFQQNARLYAAIQIFIDILILLVCICSFIRAIYKPLRENLTVIGDSIAKTPHDRSHVDPSQLMLLETRALLLSYNTMLDELEQAKAENDKLEAQSHRLIANLSHYLKSPMTNLKGYAELLEQEQLSPEEEKLYISPIHSNISTLNSMVELLSEQVKFQYNDYPLQLERRDMNDFLREVCANYYTIFEKQGFQMEIQIDEEAFYLNFDALNMRRVYANLLENILSHNTAPTQVQICTQLLPIYYQVQIKDNGAGIAAEDQDKIFEPFYQGDVSRTKQHSGLGLFVVKQILEKHGAAISLESEPAYRTVFTIRFPLP